ncbi:hypothetical protein LLID5_22970 [Lactococcus lactis]|nr:hypothetical protein LLID5_22970 [Lactococcus lactis]
MMNLKNLSSTCTLPVKLNPTSVEISGSALSKWVKQFSEVKLEDNSVLTAKQIQELQKRNPQLEEEKLILKKASAIFMQNSK